MHVAALEALELAVHPFRALLIAALQQNKASTKIPPEYAHYTDIFSPVLAIELPENSGINEHTIELSEGKQPHYGLIYSLGLVEMETLKVYIETYLKTGFIWPFKSLADVFILFDKKPGRSL